MALLCVLVYLALISACGCFFVRRWKMEPVLIIPAGLVIGSILMGGAMFFLVSTGRLSPVQVGILVTAVLVLGIFGAPTMFRSLKAVKRFLCSHVYTGRYRKVLTVVLLIGLALYLANSYTPPRNGDAMRYHLAQIKDTVQHRGFVFRPYYHYNFPQYFHYMFIPVFMVAGGIGVKLASYFYFVLTLFIALYLSFKTGQTKQLLLLALFFTFMPISTRLASVTNNDFVVLFYGLLGLLLIAEFRENLQIRYMVLAYASLGFALGCKYQAVLYIPIYILVMLMAMKRSWSFSPKYAIVIPLVLIPFAIASPFFIRNAYYTGDPVWPLLQDLFHVQKDYLYHVTQVATQRLQGQMSPAVIARSVANLGLPTHSWLIPIVWILCAGYYFAHFPSGRLYKAGVLVYFFSWFLLQPKIHARFVIYIFPILAIMSISFCEWLYGRYKRLGKLSYVLAVASIIIGIGFSIFYSTDLLKYQVTRDLKQYHQATWFYEQHQWINQNLEGDENVLVIVSSGHTYYIDREYLRADPWFSGLINWAEIRDTEELKYILRKLRVRYVFYEDRNWEYFPGGTNMMKLIHDLKEEAGASILLEDNNVKLMTLRVLRRFVTTRVFLLDAGTGF